MLGEARPKDKTGFALGTWRRRTGDVLRQEHRLVCSRDEDRKGHRPKADSAARKTTRRKSQVTQVMYEAALGLYPASSQKIRPVGAIFVERRRNDGKSILLVDLLFALLTAELVSRN